MGKFAQSLNVLLSISTLFVVLLICNFLRPDNRFYKISTLLLFSLLTVYYKTFSQARGEPYVVFFIVLSAYLLLKTLESKPQKDTFMFLGLSLGLLILSRQWGFFIFPAIFFSGIWLWIKNRTTARKLIKPLISSFAIAALVGGWFYVHLYIQYGTITAFNIEANQRIPIDEAYKLIRKTRIKDMDLFREPVRPNFYYEPTPVFYSETWGDYWGYFTFIKEKGYYGDLGLGNGSEMGPYLGRVNFASILPTLILGAGWSLAVLRLLNIKKPFSIEDTGSTLFFFIATSSIVGCAIFVLNYYVLSEPTLKATYIIQFFVVLSFLGADFLEWMRLKFSPLYTFVLFLLGLVFLHNLPAFFSRHVLFPWL